jgi:hypothetical protein
MAYARIGFAIFIVASIILGGCSHKAEIVPCTTDAECVELNPHITE